MTQLVGAICENGAKVIAVADRMVSTGDMTLAFEHSRTKIQPITDKTVVMTAGTVHEPELIREAKEKAKGKERVIEIAEILKQLYSKIREKHIIDEVLSPQGIKSFQEWHQKQSMLHDGIVIEIQGNIRNYNLQLSVILAGVDTEGHLMQIHDPGTYRSDDNLSSSCIGMGDRHATNVFAWYRYSRAFSLHDAMYIAFEAKKKAEMAGGVGQSTDMVIIDKDGIVNVKDETITELEEIYNDRETSSQQATFDRRIAELKVQTNKLEA